MALAGHVSRRLLERYSHLRLEAKIQALEKVLGSRKVEPTRESYVTKNVTKSEEAESVPAEVVENAGRPERARTADLYRVNLLAKRLYSGTECHQVSTN